MFYIRVIPAFSDCIMRRWRSNYRTINNPEEVNFHAEIFSFLTTFNKEKKENLEHKQCFFQREKIHLLFCENYKQKNGNFFAQNR